MRLGVLIIGNLSSSGTPIILYKEDETDRTDNEIIQAIMEGLEGSAKSDHYQIGMPHFDDFTEDGFGVKVDPSKAERLAVVHYYHEIDYWNRTWTLNVDIFLGEVRYCGRIHGKWGVQE